MFKNALAVGYFWLDHVDTSHNIITAKIFDCFSAQLAASFAFLTLKIYKCGFDVEFNE